MVEKKLGQMLQILRRFVENVKIIKLIIKKYKFVQRMNLLLFFINAQNANMNGEKDKYNFINIFNYINISY